jgi:predicted transposase YdaD
LSDVIWRIRFRGRDVYLFILIEFQSTVDKRMPIRLLQRRMSLAEVAEIARLSTEELLLLYGTNPSKG